jgi:hypothetical protein
LIFTIDRVVEVEGVVAVEGVEGVEVEGAAAEGVEGVEVGVDLDLELDVGVDAWDTARTDVDAEGVEGVDLEEALGVEADACDVWDVDVCICALVFLSCFLSASMRHSTTIALGMCGP